MLASSHNLAPGIGVKSQNSDYQVPKGQNSPKFFFQKNSNSLKIRTKYMKYKIFELKNVQISVGTI